MKFGGLRWDSGRSAADLRGLRTSSKGPYSMNLVHKARNRISVGGKFGAATR